MSVESAGSAKEIFLQAIEINSTADREHFVNEACRDDLPLKRGVERLLQAHESPESLLDRAAPRLVDPAPHQATEPLPEGDYNNSTIGNYKLLQKLGEGGMGVVYMAERERPVKQRVALKIIKHGMDSKKFIARFEAERQALAMMDHPNIAKVLDAGCTESGRPYFVMEMIKGVPISEYCDQNRMNTRERLELFVSVCHAVHHAHQKGIIHRDLKPTNVLVAQYDDKPVPKVIDFGVAKATNQQLTERTLFTEVGSIMGTWEYMSPEQAVLNQLDVDTRSDVYSLGVLLYELLTGETPLDRQRLRSAQLLETLRMIREDEPPKPSTRVSSLGGEAATARATYRRTKSESLASEIRGDLDWIVMKALSKERSRRYDSANRFAEDIERYINHELVEARPPSFIYQLQKFYARNKSITISAACVFSALLLTLVTVVLATKSIKDQNKLLQEAIFADLLAQSAQGDTARRNVALQKAKEYGVPSQDLEMINGLIELYGGRPKDAIEHLEVATQTAEARVAAYGLLAMAFELSGEFDRYSDLVASDLKPVTAIDYLFLGHALIYKDIRTALDYIEIAIDQDDSPLARAVYAEALNSATYNRNTNDSIWESLEQIKLAKAFLPDSPYVLESFTHINLEAAWFAEDAETKKQLLKAAGSSAERLGEPRYTHHALAHMIRAIYFDTINNRAAAIESCERLIQAQSFGWVRSNAACILYKYGRYEEAVNVFRSGSDDSTWKIMLGLLEAVEEPSCAQSHYDAILKHAALVAKVNPSGHIIPPEIILFAGQHTNDGKKASEKRLRDTGMSIWEAAMLTYLANGDETAFVASADNPSQKSLAYFMIGMVHLSDVSPIARTKAVQSFVESESQTAYGPFSGWSRAFRTRMESEPTWPIDRGEKQ